MEIDEFRDIKYEKEENGILTVTLNRPERKNALSPLTLLELWYAADHAEKDHKVKVMILTGCEEANAFCSGGYFSKTMFEEIPTKYKKEMNLRDMASKKLCLKYWDFEKPILTAINGLAVGGGFTFPLVCSDLIYMSEDSWVGLYFVKRAVMMDFGTSYLLPFYVGFQKAKELFYFGDKLSAKEVYDLGMVNEIVAGDELMEYTRAQAIELIPPHGPSLSIKLMKKTMHAYFRDIIEEQLDLENKGWVKTLTSKDFKESLEALKQKRDANFIGK
ncbi:MAG: 3-hydroxypropionyl-coenzyme A dehydratase [Promethearchaeota archaeon]|jgi:enoyl-CoA hydratase/carnithine racemase|nr:MAG: 3-hydroxypropionyl-coenzyme A dehydratase [Candidatus Lokiarchaeota archaeon]